MADRWTEAGFQRAVTGLADWLGVWHYHVHDSRRDSAGWPDLALLGDRGFMLRELKTASGRLRDDQAAWGSRLRKAGQDWAVWRPEDLASGRVQRELEAIR